MGRRDLGAIRGDPLCRQRCRAGQRTRVPRYTSQLEAATHGAGPLLVLAGAGSGKTRTLAYRVAYLTSGRAAPERILLLTFTRRAAKEMLKRAASVGSAGLSLTNRAWGGTFHAIGNRLLRIYADSAGLPRDFTILDRSDAEDLLDVLRNELGLSQVASDFPAKAPAWLYTPEGSTARTISMSF